MEQYEDAVEERLEYENQEVEQEVLDDDESETKTFVNKRKNSFVWSYFRAVPGTNNYECIVCNSCVGNQTSNLARHLASHNIQRENGPIQNCGRPSRSFIWKYCTKEDSKHARCHLCKKTLYCGGGNTTNVSKHLRRMHEHLFSSKVKAVMDDLTETTQATASINLGEGATTPLAGDVAVADVSRTPKEEKHFEDLQDQAPRRERKGGSYVWSYCDKLSRHTIRCKLCNKVMSFHGTANVITHLQRRHNIVGKVENDCSAMQNSTLDFNVSEDQGGDDQSDSYTASKRYRRSAASASVVWQYCKRVGKDAVRCGFCKKNLSYQGTSNLQRHLHRMHGVVTQGRGYTAHGSGNEDDQPTGNQSSSLVVDSNFIWLHCAMVDEEKAKCNMCSAVFDSKDTQNITRHLTVTHAIEPRQPGNPIRKTMRKRRYEYSGDDTSNDNDDFNNDDSWSRNDAKPDTLQFDEMNIKKDDSLYDDIIEEDHDQTNYDEDPFDPNMIQEIHLSNPLSPQSSRAGSPIANVISSSPKDYVNTKRMQKLSEDLVRMETEYFREKAGFYRMQKYLTALQAKKVRVELESLTHTVVAPQNGDASYAVNVNEQPSTH